MKKIYAFMLVTLFVAFAGTVFAAPADPPPPGDYRPGVMRPPAEYGKVHAFLNLTQAQKDKMKQIFNRFWVDTRDLRYQIKFKKLEYRKLFTDPRTDEQTLLNKQRELEELVVKLMARKAAMKIEWRRVLTPEQIQKLDRFPGSMRMGYHRGHDIM